MGDSRWNLAQYAHQQCVHTRTNKQAIPCVIPKEPSTTEFNEACNLATHKYENISLATNLMCDSTSNLARWKKGKLSTTPAQTSNPKGDSIRTSHQGVANRKYDKHEKTNTKRQTTILLTTSMCDSAKNLRPWETLYTTLNRNNTSYTFTSKPNDKHVTQLTWAIPKRNLAPYAHRHMRTFTSQNKQSHVRFRRNLAPQNSIEQKNQQKKGPISWNQTSDHETRQATISNISQWAISDDKLLVTTKNDSERTQHHWVLVEKANKNERVHGEGGKGEEGGEEGKWREGVQQLTK